MNIGVFIRFRGSSFFIYLFCYVYEFKSLVQFALTLINGTNAAKSVSKVDWILAFYYFVDTQRFFVVFQGLFQFAFTIIHRTNVVESNTAVEWILAFYCFVDTQRSFVVFECLV
jgi:hypothetical protein